MTAVGALGGQAYCNGKRGGVVRSTLRRPVDGAPAASAPTLSQGLRVAYRNLGLCRADPSHPPDSLKGRRCGRVFPSACPLELALATAAGPIVAAGAPRAESPLAVRRSVPLGWMHCYDVRFRLQHRPL